MLDFALILVVLTATAGVVWLLDVVAAQARARLRRRGARRAKCSEPIVVEYAKSFFPILLLVLLIRSFLFEPFRIPSESMMPTLLEGDFIFVNKFAYGLRLPVLNTKIVQIGEPQHGDVVVFRLPSDPSVDYIKRVVGLPGDVVEYEDGEQAAHDQRRAGADARSIGPYEDEPYMVIGREKLGEHDHQVLLTARSP